MYDIRLSKEADRALRRMPRNMAAKIIEKIKVVSADPYTPNNNVKALTGRPGYRLRVGDWRVIYDLNDQLTILAVLSSIAGVARFSRPEQLSSYWGVCSSVYQSGATLRLGSLTRRGNVHVRWLLSQALQHLHRKDARARKRYLKLKRKKPRGVARAAQVRWLTQIIWHLLKKDEPYRIKAAA